MEIGLSLDDNYFLDKQNDFFLEIVSSLATGFGECGQWVHKRLFNPLDSTAVLPVT